MKVCSDCRRCFDDSEAYCSEDSHPPLSQIRNGSPEIIPGYRAELFLGSDIKGEIFYAHNAAGAACLITIRSASEELSRQFLAEAELAAAFCHPNVVDVYEAGRLDTGEVFVVSEDARGKTLRHLLQAERVPNLLTTVRVVRQAAEALHGLHTSGLTHGAINPQNIILTTDAQDQMLVRIKDLDLGGVVTRSVVFNKLHSDPALDSLRYFAPEQCSGGGTSPKADIYSLGIVLHEMLAGAPPFNASKAVGLIEQHRNQPPPEIQINDIDLRMLLTHTLMEALRKQPGLRQASANVLARQMRHMEQLATHSSVPPPALPVPLIPPNNEVVVNAVVRPVPVIEMPRAAHAESTRLAPAGKGPRRSRMRVLKRKLRSMAPHPPEIPAVPSEGDVLETSTTPPINDNSFLLTEPQPTIQVPGLGGRFPVDLEPPKVPVRFLPYDRVLTQRPQKVVFLPSLGGAAAIRETVYAEPSGPMFSSFYGESSIRHSRRIVGAGIVMLAALAFVGRVVMREPVPVETQSKPPASTTRQISPPQAVQPVADSPVSPTTEKQIEIYPRQEPEFAQAKSLPIINTQPSSAKRYRDPTVEDGPKTRTPNAALVSRNLGPMPSPFSTVVITYGNGKVSSRSEPGRSTADSKPAAPPKKTSDPARPRIVKDPN